MRHQLSRRLSILFVRQRANRYQKSAHRPARHCEFSGGVDLSILAFTNSTSRCGGCLAAWWFSDVELLSPVLSSAIMCVLLPTAFWVLSSYVRQKADYYAHAFFSEVEFLSFSESGQDATLSNGLPE